MCGGFPANGCVRYMRDWGHCPLAAERTGVTAQRFGDNQFMRGEMMQAGELPLLTPELLFELSRDIKGGYLTAGMTNEEKRGFSHKSVKVCRNDINAVADALKFVVFFIPTYVYNVAFQIAQQQGASLGD